MTSLTRQLINNVKRFEDFKNNNTYDHTLFNRTSKNIFLCYFILKDIFVYLEHLCIPNKTKDNEDSFHKRNRGAWSYFFFYRNRGHIFPHESDVLSFPRSDLMWTSDHGNKFLESIRAWSEAEEAVITLITSMHSINSTEIITIDLQENFATPYTLVIFRRSIITWARYGVER